MNRICIVIALTGSLWALPISLYAQSGSIYSWTDENGIKHYSDRPPAEVATVAEEIPLEPPTAPTDADTANPNNEPLADAEAAADASLATATTTATAADELSYADQRRQEIQEKRKSQQEKTAERNQICLQARDELARVEPNRRVLETDESGETSRLDDNARMQLVEDSKARIAEYCE